MPRPETARSDLLTDLRDQPFPKGERLGVRVIHAEDADAVVATEIHDAEQFVPQRLPVLALKIEGINVLILLRRILGVLDRAIRPMTKPLGMLADIGMIGRALEGQIHRELDASIAGGG